MLPRFARHTISILNLHILIKNIKKLFIFEAPDYILRPKLHLFTLKYQKKFQKFFTSLRSAYYFNSQLTYLIKNIKKLFIFEALNYILRPKLHLFTLK